MSIESEVYGYGHELEELVKKMKDIDRQTLLAIYDSLKETGYMPTFRELLGPLGLNSICTISNRIKRLEDLELIGRKPKTRRMKITESGNLVAQTLADQRSKK